MINEKIAAMENIANVHIQRINIALEHLQKLKSIPYTARMITELSEEQLLYTELLTSRFSKLQDHLGANVFDLFFVVFDEPVDNFTMIDKLNKLEKLGVLKDAHIWREIRKVRNIIAHEYPDNPELIAKTLNEIVGLCPVLIAISSKIFERMRN